MRLTCALAAIAFLAPVAAARAEPTAPAATAERLKSLQRAAIAARDVARDEARAKKSAHASPAAVHHHEAPVGESPDKVWSELLEGNRRFVDGRPRPRELIRTRQRLARGQNPRAAILACADSRVGPELLFDQSLGDLFVVRTAGNIADPIALGSIEYAVEHLGVRLLIVLGHESCGAVKAAASGQTPHSPNLQAIVSKIRPGIEGMEICGTGSAAERVKVHANVEHSAQSVLAESALLKAMAAKGELMIVKGVYVLSSGEVLEL